MADPNTVFLSYRREVSWALSHLVRDDLSRHGFDVFLDVHGIGSGEFERVLLQEIAERAHFLLLLEPRSLDRTASSGDWLHREIAHALMHQRNVVPLLANGAVMPRSEDLPADIARVSAFNAVSVPPDYFPEAMQKLRDQFLRSSGTQPRPITPTTTGEDSVVRRPLVGGPPQLTARRVSSQSVRLTWTRVSGATGYLVQRSDCSTSFGGLTVYTGKRLTAWDRWASGPEILYRVRAERTGVAGVWSDPVRLM